MECQSKIELQNIAGGALQELFANNFNKILENLYDKNTSYKTARILNIELKFTASDDDREIISVDISSKIKLAPIKGVATKLLLDRSGNKIIAAEFGNQMKGQLSLTDSEESETNYNNGYSEKVTPLFKAE